MKLTIMTPGKAVVDAEVSSVTLPAALGRMTALQGHDTLLALLNPGNIHFVKRDNRGGAVREDYDIGSGFAEVIHDMVTVCVSEAVPAAAAFENGRKS